MYQVTEQYGNRTKPCTQFTCDKEADVSTIPKKSIGDVAYVIETGNVYMCNSSGEWILQ